MNEDLHLTHCFHETLQHFHISNINLGKPFHHSVTNTKFNKKRAKWREMKWRRRRRYKVWFRV
jgi:hypothetical protein